MTTKVDLAKLVETQLPKTNQDIKISVESFAQLQKELHDSAEIIVPLMRNHLSNIQSVRMAFGREVVEILRSGRELLALSKNLPELEKLIKTLMLLKELATAENIELMRKLVREDKK